MKNFILAIIALAIITIGFYFVYKNSGSNGQEIETENSNQETELNDNKKQELETEVLKEGSGQEAKNNDMVTVHYAGSLEDGTKFDSSIDRGEPFVFTLGISQVIEGWDLGILGMKIGEKRKLIIPPELGYGETGTPGGPIPPNAVLIFEVELLSIDE